MRPEDNKEDDVIGDSDGPAPGNLSDTEQDARDSGDKTKNLDPVSLEEKN